MEIKKGQIYYADLGQGVGSEQNGHRPVLIIQNDKGNKFSPTTIIAILTSRQTKAKLPTHYWIDNNGLRVNSLVELEQIRTIDKSRLGKYLGCITAKQMIDIDKCLKISLGIGD